MSEEHLLVLLVDDEASLRTPLARYLSNMYRYHVDTAANEEEAWERVLGAERPYDVALIDDLLTSKPGAEPEPIGIGLMARIQERCPETVCIIFTGWGMDRALEALQAGAYRYLAKPLNLDELGMTIRMAAEQGWLRQERDLLSATLEISRAMLSELNVGKTLEVIAEAVPKLVGAEACAVARVDPARDQVWREPMVPLGDAAVRWYRHLQGVELTKRIFETGEVFVLPDVDARIDEVDRNLRRAGVKSFIGVPIPGEPENWGVLYAYSTRREAFGTYERRVLQLLAGQAAIALENARLFEAETQRRREAETLRETALALTTTLEQQEIFERILTEFQKVVPYDSASVQLLKEDRLEIIGGRGFPNLQAILGLSFPVDGDNPNREVVRRRDWFIVPDASAVYEGFSKEPHVQAGIRGWLGVPMLVGNRFIGMIALDKRQPGFYTEEHAQLAQTFAAQAALAIENARLFNEVNRRARNLETLQNLALTVSSSLDLDETLKAACQAATEFFHADHSGLVLFAPDFAQGQVRAEYPALGTLGTTIPLRGVPAEERLIETQEQLVIHDVAGDESLREVRDILLGFDIQSILIVPVMSKDGGVLGSFSVDAVGHCRQFTAQEVELCRVFAAHVAAAVENARLFEDAREGRAYVQSLYEASSAIISPQDPGQVLQAIVATACKVTGAWRAAVLLVDEGEQPKVLAQAGFDSKLETATAIRSGGISKEVICSKQPRFFSDALAVREKLHPSMIEQGARAATCLPLLLRGKAIGVLWIQFRQPHPFSLTEKQALQLYANQSAVAYDTARRMRELEHLRRAAEKLASVATVQDVLQQIVKSAKEVLAADSAVIWSYDDTRHAFLPDQLVAEGIKPELVEKFREDEPHRGGTAEIVMKRNYLAVPDIDDPEYTFLGPAGRGLRGAIGVKAFQGIALQVGNDTLGVLYVNYEHPRNFSAEDRTTLETFAYHAVLTLKKAKLLEQVGKARDTAKIVAEVSILEDLRSTLNSIAQGTQDALHCDAVTLYTYDQIRDEFGFPPAIVGVRDTGEVLKFGFVAKESVIRKILTLDEAYVAEDASSDPLMGGAFVKREEIKSSLGIPLKVGGRKVGVMFVNYRSRHRFTSEEVTNIELFAHQAAVAIRNAQLYESERKRVNALRALYEASQAVTGTLTLDELLNHIVEQAWRLAGPRGEKTHFSHLALTNGNYIKFAAAHPPKMLSTLQEKIDLKSDVPIGITGRVVLTGQSQLVGNVLEDHDYIETDPHVRSQLSVSIQMGEQVIGVIGVEHPDYEAFDEEDRHALEALAAQAAVAIENARLYEREQRRAREAEAMVRVGQAISSTLDLDRILETVAKNALPLLGLEDGRSTIFLVDEKTGDIVRPTRVPPHKNGNGPRRRGGLTSLVIETGEPIVIPDVRRDSRVRVSVVEEGVRSLIGVPLKVKERTIGVLFANTLCPRDFTQRDIEMLSSLASEAAVAIENARLYVKQQQEAKQLALINQIAAEISSSLDLEKILQTLVDELARVMGVEQCAIAIFDEKGEYGDVVAEYLEEGCVTAKGLRIPLRDNPSIEIVCRTKRPLAVKDAQHDPRMEKVWDIMKRRRTQSIMIVPIVIGDRVIGTIGLDAVSGSREFTEEEIWLAETIAHHAAIAVQSAQLYRQATERLYESQALQQVAASLAGTLGLEEVLRVVIGAAMDLTDTDSGSFLFWDSQAETFTHTLTTTGPDRTLQWYRSRARREGGITRAIIDERKSIVISDTRKDPRVSPIALEKGRLALIGVPLVSRQKVIGALYVSNSEPRQFSNRQVALLEPLASQAAVAIERAREYEELKQTKGLVGARTVLAWMGMISAAWRHAIEGHAISIREQIQRLRSDLSGRVSTKDVERLSTIERLADRILQKPITPPLSTEGGAGSVLINDLVRERIEQLWDREPYKSAHYQLDLALEESATVRASSEWLKRALDVLIDNSVEAVVESATKQITISTRLADSSVEIVVTDTGEGISDDVLAKLFQEQIKKPKGTRGLGMGLLMAQTIVQTYRGEIRVDSTGPTGTTMVVRLPLEA